MSRFTQTLSTSPGQIEKEISPTLPTTSLSDQGSNYCRVTWICSCDGMEPTGQAVSKKRKRNDDTSRHLCIQVFLGEAKAGELVLCFASSSTTETEPPENNDVSSFDYLLVRGRKTAYEAVWSWLKKTTGCWISNASCQFTSAEITLATAQWTRQALERQSKKPLSLIFQVPPHLQKSGLETVTVTIPPASLDHFCQCIKCETTRAKSRRAFTHSQSSTGLCPGSFSYGCHDVPLDQSIVRDCFLGSRW